MRCCPAFSEPGLDISGDELGAVITANKARNAPRREQRSEGRNYCLAGQGNADRHRQPLARELIQDVQKAYLPTRQQRVFLEVVAPDLIRTLRLAWNGAARLDLTLLGTLRHL